MGLNFEQVWAALMQMKETQQETDRQMSFSGITETCCFPPLVRR
jgi:hypothetical protein